MNTANTGRGRDELFKRISDVSFVLDELRLYLDTHPTNTDALSMFAEYQKQRAGMISDYTEKYGPIEAYCAESDPGLWTWATENMPWECK